MAKQINRRDFLAAAGATGAVVAGATGVEWLLLANQAGAAHRTKYRLLRPSDQMIIELDLLDMVVNGGLLAPSGPKPGIRFTFGSQHTAEEALDGSAGTPFATTNAVDHYSAEPSRVVFDVPAAIPFTLTSLLAVSDRDIRLDPRAPNIGQSSSTTGAPAVDVTSIELPTDLVISPNQFGKFLTSPPSTVDDVTEIFRMRLGRGTPAEEPPDVTPQGRAIYTAGDTDPHPSFYIPDTAQRAALVTQYAATTEKFGIRRLWLSSAGGNFDTTTETWTQKVVTGRDVFVEYVSFGYLMPWGIPMSIVEQSTRRFVGTTDPIGGPADKGQTAVMVYERFIEITPGELTLNSNAIPFETIRYGPTDGRPITQEPFNGVANPEDAYWLIDGATGEPFEYTITAVDKAGLEHEITMAAAYVAEAVAEAGTPTVLNTVIARYNDTNGIPGQTLRRQADMGGARVGWAPSRTIDGEEGVRSTDLIRYRLGSVTGSTGVPGFAPEVEATWIVDDAVSGALGEAGSARQAHVPTAWLDEADSALNPAGTFLEYSSEILVHSFTGDGSGLGSPGFSIKGISLSFGAGPSYPTVATAGATVDWDPSEVFDFGALSLGKILGIVKLEDLLPTAIPMGATGSNLDPIDFPEIPRFSIDPPSIPGEICYRFEWEPDGFVSPFEGVFLSAADAPGVSGATKLRIVSTNCISTTGGKPKQTTTVELKKFGLVVPPLLPAIELGFKSIKYEKTLGKDATSSAEFAGMAFVGNLSWLDPLVAFFEKVGDNFGVAPSTTAIEIDAYLPIPPINLGAVSIKNLVGHIGVVLPFDNSPAFMNLSVGTKKDPFSVTILAAGGKGWFDVDLSADPETPGIVRLYAGMAVSYEAGINVVVAKVTITAEIGGGIEIENGEVAILFFVSLQVEAALLGAKASLKAELALLYKPATEKLKGTVTVTATFTILGESVSKMFDIEQEFQLGNGDNNNIVIGGPGGPPQTLAAASTGFADQYSSTSWTDYCAAFA